MAYHHLPINGAAGITFENAEAFGRLMDASDGPIMVHCASGNRVGALFAIKSYRVDGASAEDALALGYRAGLTGLQGYVRQLLVFDLCAFEFTEDLNESLYDWS